MRPIDADTLISEIKKDVEKAIEQDDKVEFFWLGYIAGLVIKQPTIQSEQLESDDVTFWKKRAKEYEEMVGELTAEMARGVKVDSVLLTEEGIAFKKKKSEPSWIPCSERFPDIAQRVLLSGHGAVIVGMLHSSGKYSLEPTGISCVYSKDDIKAWMPLPEPYQSEAERKTDETR